MQVLSIDKALPLQAHPSARHAQALHAGQPEVHACLTCAHRAANMRRGAWLLSHQWQRATLTSTSPTATAHCSSTLMLLTSQRWRWHCRAASRRLQVQHAYAVSRGNSDSSGSSSRVCACTTGQQHAEAYACLRAGSTLTTLPFPSHLSTTRPLLLLPCRLSVAPAAQPAAGPAAACRDSSTG